LATDFATNPTTTSTFDDVSYSAIITDEVLEALMAIVVTPQLLNRYDIMGQATKAVKIPKADKFTAAAVSEGTELTNTALTTTSVTITASEIGIQATITDVLDVSDISSAQGARLKQLGRALADKVDIDICALLSGFSTSVGGTGVNLSLTNVLDAIYNLEVADAAGLGALVGVLHPRQTADIRTEIEADGTGVYDSKTDADLSKSQAGFFGNWMDINFYQSTNVATANVGADRAGAIFVNDYALGMVEKWSARVEAMRWAPIRGFVLVATAMYGVGEVEDLAGVAVTTDA